MIVAETVVEEMQARGWSISDLARETGVEEFRLQMVVNHPYVMNREILCSLSRAFGTSITLWENLWQRDLLSQVGGVNEVEVAS